MLLRLIIFLILTQIHVVSFSLSAGRDSIHQPFIFTAGIGLHYGFVFAHSKAVQNTKGAHPWGIEIDLSRRIINNTTWDECRCYPRAGLVISYFDLDNKIIGKAINAGAYIEPFFFARHRINLSLKGVAGVSYLTNPYDAVKNPDNNSYSTTLNAYLALGFGMSVNLSPKVSVKLSAYYNHNSNGGIKQPNSGINWPAGTIHLYYTAHPSPLPVKHRSPFSFFNKKPLLKEIFLLGTQRSDGKESKANYLIIGIGLKISKQISGINALNAGFELVADYSLRKRLEQNQFNHNNFIQAGLLAGHEFLMGKFTFSQQLGIYVINQEPYNDAVYQRYGLTFKVTKYFSIGINAKAHRQVAAFLDGRISYLF